MFVFFETSWCFSPILIIYSKYDKFVNYIIKEILMKELLTVKKKNYW